MTDTLDPSAPAKQPEEPEITERNLTPDNDNLTLVSLEDLKRFRANLFDSTKMSVVEFLDEFIEDIEEDKARQLAEAEAAMDKFNPVTPIGDV